MLFKGIPGYVVEPTGEIGCMDCSVDFLLEHGYTPTEDTDRIASLLSDVNFIRVRKWVSLEHEDMWLQELGEEV